MKNVDDLNFKSLVTESKGNVVIDIFAEWCGPCKMVAPVLEKLEETNENIKFYKCNIDESPEISKLLSIRSIPTVIFVKDGRIKDFIVGARPAPFYEKKITEHFDS